MKKSLLTALWITTGILLAAGFYLPLITVSQFYIFDNSVAMWSALYELFLSQDYFLFAVVFVFSALIPSSKWLVIGLAIREKTKKHTFMNLLHKVGKWSMLDVFVVALLLVMLKISVAVDAQIQVGLYSFAAALLLELALMHALQRST